MVISGFICIFAIKKMQTIYPIIKPYDKLLGKQKLQAGKHYRLMNFVVKQKVTEGTLLYHTMTKALILLTDEEMRLLEQAPANMPQLIEEWFLVPEQHDDRLLSRQMRAVGKMIEKPVTSTTIYTIFTTTDCNARCFYCFQKGLNKITMTEGMARRVADYIIHHYNGEKLTLHWFGGEPLYNKPVITQICLLLKEAGVEYSSQMISNGYLIDDEITREAKTLWNLKKIQITLDGTEKIYNQIKAYIYKDINAYRKVIDNIHRLLDSEIKVMVRLNIDMHNADDLIQLVEDLHDEFKGKKGLYVYQHTLFGEVAKHIAFTDDIKRKELFEKISVISSRLDSYKLSSKYQLGRRVRLRRCIADNDRSIVILPDGNIGKCDNDMSEDYIGHIDSEKMDEAVINSFKECYDEIEACATCFDYPNCIRLKKCDPALYCYQEMRDENYYKIKQGMLMAYDKFLNGQIKQQEDEVQD